MVTLKREIIRIGASCVIMLEEDLLKELDYHMGDMITITIDEKTKTKKQTKQTK
jgi:antitoxin component of MazEF toxin-antitoxin module